MLAFVRVVMIATFVSVAVVGSASSAYPAEEAQDKVKSVVGSASKAVLGGALRWVAEKALGIGWDRFQIRACDDKTYRKSAVEHIKTKKWIEEAQSWMEQFVTGVLRKSWADAINNWLKESP